MKYKYAFCFFLWTKACAWGLYIFLVRRHCRKRPIISLFFYFLAFLLHLLFFLWCNGVLCDIALRFQWLWPPTTPHLEKPTPNNPPYPNHTLLPAALGQGDYALLSLPFVWGASLGIVFTSAVAFFTSVSPLVLSSFTVLPLWGQTQERERPRKRQKERKFC